ncbi:GLPGLI family protein [Olleya aquimaris]|uniref:GLPGLI family protein n=1 Tax=Olleya aquimaris TaxID=639310 RepID=A0A327RE43_9FLAO|nr:GLPGLI family protein [Olleya aquimaris]RAJ15159.1 GLPGLI family protein [Olleya aquimaris]
MKLKSILKNVAIVLVAITATNTLAQDGFQGQAVYMSKTTVDMDNFGGREMSPERKKMIMERMKSMLEKTYILDFNKTESIYKEDEALEAPGGRGGFSMGGMSAGPIYKNVKDNKLVQDQEFFGKQFLIKDSLPKLEWKMSGESKQIGKYTCFKATATKKVDAADWTNMRRRDRDRDKKDEDKETTEVEKDSTKTDAPKDPFEEIEIPEEIEVTAWYTMDIPVNNGPGEYWGLPGLILEVNSGRTTILCSKIVMNPSDKNDIKEPTKGKEVSMEEYQDIVKKKMEEMREMFRSRGGRGGGRRN